MVDMEKRSNVNESFYLTKVMILFLFCEERMRKEEFYEY